ncbi:MAG: GDP-mannose 4,6-dehydratase [Deltaproteobacteria bacterium]|nr:MAG: GDP-mannose 4,6-dehydratase [Deltaproteobacteria bacterium]
MKVLVTGAGGFVGGRLLPRLEREGARVVGIDRELDVSRPAGIDALLDAERPNAIVHLAALSSVPRSRAEPDLTYRVNFLGTRVVLDATRRFAPGARVLVVSTGEVYGPLEPDAPPSTEASPLRPASPYAAAKASADLLARSFAAGGLDVVRARPFNHTGPGQRDEFVASSFARQIAEIEAGVRAPRLAVGNLDSVRDFLDVDDVIEAYWRLLDPATPAGVYNVATAGAVTIREVLDALLAHARVAPAVEVDPRLYRPTDAMRGDAHRIRQATGWEPRTPLRDTLGRLLDHWRQNVATA